MPFSLRPKIILNALTDVSPELLHQREITLLMLDFDNTIVPYSTDVPTEIMSKWLHTMAASDIAVCIVTNSKNDRVPRFCEKYGLDCIMRAKKPGTRGIRECLRRYDTLPEHAALVGDQIFTDTLGGNSAGVTTILITAIHNHNIWLKARHVLELPFIFASRKRRIDL